MKRRGKWTGMQHVWERGEMHVGWLESKGVGNMVVP